MTGILLLSWVFSILASPSVHASGSWTFGGFSWGESKELTTSSDNRECRPILAKIIGVTSVPELANVCVYDRPSFRYGAYHKYIDRGYMSYTQSYFVVSIGSDHNMYIVDNMDAQNLPLDVPGSDDLHFNRLTMGFTNNHLLSYIPDFPKQLQRINSFGDPVRYQFTEVAKQPFIAYDQTDAVTTGAMSVSENGSWIVAEVMGAGLVRINTATRKIDGFSNYVHRYGVGSDAHINFRISNDGTKIAAFDYNISPVIYTLDAACLTGTSSYSEAFRIELSKTSCPTDGGRLHEAFTQRFSLQEIRSTSATKFNSDGDTLYFDTYTYDDDWMNQTVHRMPLYAGSYSKEKGIEYLALGDSFTSGEGDIEKKMDGSSYYLEGTELPGQCHVSGRSYPFLLQAKKAIDSTRMHSVACSGAQIMLDYMAPADTYLGQGGRLGNLSTGDMKDARQTALSNFTSGHIPQIEFIKKHQPKTITLMGGGNDVGFGDILRYCASPTWGMLVADDTCGYAIKDHPLRKMFAQTIQGQYDYTLLLLRKIKQASPETTVYVIGYPSFISEEPGINCFNSASLDSSERRMVNEGVTFMNTMLELAAGSMGVQYIDIQDTLEGGRLCEGSEYVTGLADIGIGKVMNNDTQESFHPNARAHEKIADRILANDFRIEPNRNMATLSQAMELSVPLYFGGGTSQKQVQQRDIANDTASEQSEMVVYMSDGSLAPGSDVTLTMFSDTIDLGDASVDENGGLGASVKLPVAAKPGRHVLVLDGFSPSGESVQYFQFVTIMSQDKDDQDSDGILDINDHCLFITTWIDEATQQDVCLSATSQEDARPEESVASSGQLLTDWQHESKLHELSKNKSAVSMNSSLLGSTRHDQLAQSDNVSGMRQQKQLSVGSRHDSDSSGLGLKMPDTNVRDTLKNESELKASNSYSSLILGGIISVSTLVLGYGIVGVIRR